MLLRIRQRLKNCLRPCAEPNSSRFRDRMLFPIFTEPVSESGVAIQTENGSEIKQVQLPIVDPIRTQTNTELSPHGALQLNPECSQLIHYSVITVKDFGSMLFLKDSNWMELDHTKLLTSIAGFLAQLVTLVMCFFLCYLAIENWLAECPMK